MTGHGYVFQCTLLFMTASVQIVSCLFAIAASAKLAVSEYTRLRKSRQLKRAVWLALGHPGLQA
jgi:hypothetical protein